MELQSRANKDAITKGLDVFISFVMILCRSIIVKIICMNCDKTHINIDWSNS